VDLSARYDRFCRGVEFGGKTPRSAKIRQQRRADVDRMKTAWVMALLAQVRR
jgi:hypothetical protein